MTAFGLNLTPSPLRVLDRGLSVLRADWGRPLLALGLFFLLPYLAGYFVIYAPLIDGRRDYSAGYDTPALVRYYGFIVWYFLVSGLSYVSTGHLMYARLTGADLTFVAMARQVPSLLWRGLVVYLVLSACVYLAQYAGVITAIPFSLAAALILPSFVYARNGLITALRDGWNLGRGRWVALWINIALLTGFGVAAQMGIGWLNARLAGDLAFGISSCLLGLAYAVVLLISTSFSLSLYACARDDTAPPEAMADLFE